MQETSNKSLKIRLFTRACHQLERMILLKAFGRDTRKKMFCIAELWGLFFDVVGRQKIEKSTFCLIGDTP